MNNIWTDFLTADQRHCINETNTEFTPPTEAGNNHVYALTHLTVLTVSGTDAAKFLQGQVTCNVNDVTETKASFGAFCNAKGRAITTFLLIKIGDVFALILPADLLDKVQKKLQLYILRSDVQLNGSPDNYGVIGLSIEGTAEGIELPQQDLETTHSIGYIVKMPSANRYLMVSDTQTAIKLWSRLTDELNIQPKNADQWRSQDILAGIPWLSSKTSEEFIPQMLNLDKFGGISFNKGCYTGQEIIARTHYLGKNKRELYLAETNASPAPEPNSSILDQNGQPVGKVLLAVRDETNCKMLVVLPTERTASDPLMLEKPANHSIQILTLIN